MKKTVPIVLGLAIAGAVAFGLYEGIGKDADETGPRRLGEFIFYDHEGAEVRTADLIGKPIVLSSWATWCSHCRETAANLRKFSKESGIDPVVILVNRGENVKIATGTLEVLDPADSFYKSIGGYQMPETIFVDKDGVIVMHKRGPMNFEEIKRRAEDAFNL